MEITSKLLLTFKGTPVTADSCAWPMIRNVFWTGLLDSVSHLSCKILQEVIETDPNDHSFGLKPNSPNVVFQSASCPELSCCDQKQTRACIPMRVKWWRSAPDIVDILPDTSKYGMQVVSRTGVSDGFEQWVPRMQRLHIC